ncbi:MAG: site-specific integrase [Pseudomonadota bacterium]
MATERKTGVEGVHIVTSRKAGKPVRYYIYAWRGGPRIRTVEGGSKPTITKADVIAIGAALETAKPVPKDTISGLATAYRSGPEWKALEASTRDTWGRALDKIEAKWGEVPLRLWCNPRMVTQLVKWRDSMAETPRAADMAIAQLTRLLEFARLRGQVTVNIASGIPTLYRNAQRAEIIWTDEDFETWNSHKKVVQSIRDVAALAAQTGLRRADLIGLTWSEIGDVAITRIARKKSRGKRRRVVMPILPTLQHLLDDLKTRPRKAGVETVLVTSHGTPWSGNGLSGSFGKAIRETDLHHVDSDGEKRWKHLHDIRGTYATKLMTAPGLNLTDKEIGNLMGWSPEQVAEIRSHYVDDAAIVVALGERLAQASVKRSVKR